MTTEMMSQITTPTSLDLDALAWAIDADGLAAHEDAAGQVAQLAAAASVTPTMVEVLRDTHAPTAVRERAFGLVAVALARVAGASDQEMAFAN